MIIKLIVALCNIPWLYLGGVERILWGEIGWPLAGARRVYPLAGERSDSHQIRLLI
jgi:hypothetical protein